MLVFGWSWTTVSLCLKITKMSHLRRHQWKDDSSKFRNLQIVSLSLENQRFHLSLLPSAVKPISKVQILFKRTNDLQKGRRGLSRTSPGCLINGQTSQKVNNTSSHEELQKISTLNMNNLPNAFGS